MRVAIFSGTEGSVQNEVNELLFNLAEESIVDIKYSTVFNTNLGTFYHSAMIIYKV